MATSYPKLDSSLVRAALKASSDRPYCFALIPKNSTEGVLMMGRQRISPKLIKAAREKFNGPREVTGVCFGEKGALVFEQARRPEPGWEKVTKLLLKTQASYTSTIEFRQGRDDSGFEDESADAIPSEGMPKASAGQSTPSLPSADAAEPGAKDHYQQRLGALQPRLERLLKRTPTEAQKLQPLMAFAQAKAESGDFKAASDALMQLLARVESADPQPKAPLEKKSPTQSMEDEFRLRLTKTIQRIKRVEDSGTKIPPDGVASLESAKKSATGKDFSAALQALDKLDIDLVQADRQALVEEISSIRRGEGLNDLTPMEGDPSWFTETVKPIKAQLAELFKSVVQIKPSSNSFSTLSKAHEDLQTILGQFPAVVQEANRKRESYHRYNNEIRPQVEAALKLSSVGHVALIDAQAALRQAASECSSEAALAQASSIQTQQLLDSITVALNRVQAISTERISNLAKTPGVKPKAVRAQTLKLMKEDPQVLARLADSPEGRKILDDLVADIGSTAKGDTDHVFMIAALQARFGAKFSGDLAHSAGPRLYKAFAMVPDVHTRLNPKIAEVKRNKNYDGSSWYGTHADKGEDVGAHHIVLNGVRTGGIKGWVVDTVAGTDNETQYRNVKGDKKLNAFDAVTLHEIGHGVDEKLGFMEKNGSASKYGRWMQHDVREVADIIGQETGFFEAFWTHPHPMLRNFLEQALSADFVPSKFKGLAQAAAKVKAPALKNDAGVKQAVDSYLKLSNSGLSASKLKSKLKAAQKAALGAIELKSDAKLLAQAVIDLIFDASVDIRAKNNNTGLMSYRKKEDVIDEAVDKVLSFQSEGPVDWDALTKHKAVTICQAIKLKGSDTGLWALGEGAKKFAVGGRVYQEAYRREWNSYDPSALANRVTNYQFRAPGEWFADAYSAYYLGKLPDSHPLTAVLIAQATPQ